MKLYQYRNKIVIKNKNGSLVCKSGQAVEEIIIKRQGFEIYAVNNCLLLYWTDDRRKHKRRLNVLAKRYLNHTLRLVEIRQLYYRLNKDYTEDKIFHVDHFVLPKNQALPTPYWPTDSILVTFKEV